MTLPASKLQRVLSFSGVLSKQISAKMSDLVAKSSLNICLHKGMCRLDDHAVARGDFACFILVRLLDALDAWYDKAALEEAISEEGTHQMDRRPSARAARSVVCAGSLALPAVPPDAGLTSLLACNWSLRTSLTNF